MCTSGEDGPFPRYIEGYSQLGRRDPSWLKLVTVTKLQNQLSSFFFLKIRFFLVLHKLIEHKDLFGICM